MAKRKSRPQDPSTDETASTPEEAKTETDQPEGGEVQSTETTDPQAPSTDEEGSEEADEEQEEQGETVPALVLHDSVYGKCGQVKSFPVDQVEAIEAAGYIDTHPNAIKSAK